MSVSHAIPPRFHQRVEQEPGMPRLLANASRSRVNVGNTERAISAAVGGALLGCGLLRPGLSAVACAILGGGLIYRGLSGHCALYESMKSK